MVAERLVKKYGEVLALRGVSFRVRRGEIFGFLGPNGAGKTTTMHILATLLKPTSGRAVVAGYDVLEEPREVRKRIGMVFQDPSLDTDLTAYENLYIHGKLYGVRGRELEERIRELLEFVELWEHRDRLVKTFSGGMRRRLEVARALLHDPEILFLDEPTLGLDPQTRAHIWEYIKRLRREKGVTIFLTTHYMDEAEELCDEIAIIDRGRIIAEGTAEQLKSMIGDEIVYLTVEGNGDPCRTLSMGFVKECRRLGGSRLSLRVVNASEALPLLIQRASESGFKVREASYRRPTLNDVFLHLTGREIRDTGAEAFETMRMIIRRGRF